MSSLLRSTGNVNVPNPFAPERWNDADVRGHDGPEWQALLSRTMTFAVAQRANVSEWSSESLTFEEWLHANGGLTRHHVRRKKEGRAYVFGALADGSRTAKGVVSVDAIGIDVDNGHPLEDVADRIEAAGIAAVIYTSFSHRKTSSELSRDHVMKAAGIDRDPTDEEVREFLCNAGKMIEEIAETARIVEAKRQDAKGVMIVVEHDPVPKYRIVFPLSETVTLIDTAPTHAAALQLFGDKVIGLAVDVAGVDPDTSCAEPCRAFYTPRHRKGAEFFAAILRGKPLAYDEIPTRSKRAYVAQRRTGEAPIADDGQRFRTPGGRDLEQWAAQGFAVRFEAARAVEELAPDRVRNVVDSDKIEVECPFDEMHSNACDPNDRACFVSNGDGDEGFRWSCRHDSCQDFDRLDMVKKALADEWFSEDVLNDEDAGYLLPEGEEVVIDDGSSPMTASEKAAKLFGPHSTEGDILKFMMKQIRIGEMDAVERQRVTDVLAEKTPVKLRTINQFWKTAVRQEKTRAEKANPENTNNSPLVNEADFHDLVKFGMERIAEANKERPQLFDFSGQLATIRRDHRGVASPHVLAEAGFAHVLNTVATWSKSLGDTGARQGVAAPREVVSHLYQGDRAVFPRLETVAVVPHFSPSGTLVDTPGYYPETATFLAPPDGFEWGAVSHTPSAGEIAEAKDIIIADVLGDFPLGGLSRDEIEKCKDASVRSDASVANAVAMILLPFMREMIRGATPGHVITKPTPGTGAGYLAAVSSIIATGSRAPALSYPKNPEEVGKVLTSVLSQGRSIIFFDNIPAAMDSDALAKAMTERYSDRLLGGNRVVDLDVRAQWIFTANNIKMSGELVRRCVMIELDTHMVDPTKRGGFRHADIEAHVSATRGRIVWACLTLIRNWIAKGCPPHRADGLGNFSEWSEKVGGVLDEAGVGGFLANREEFASYAETSDAGSVQLLMNEIAELKDGTILRPGGTSQLVKAGDIAKFGNADAESILDILNRANDGLALLIDGWGYSRHDAAYMTARGIVGPFRDAARRPWVCETKDGSSVEIGFEIGKDKNGAFFILEKRPQEQPKSVPPPGETRAGRSSVDGSTLRKRRNRRGYRPIDGGRCRLARAARVGPTEGRRS